MKQSLTELWGAWVTACGIGDLVTVVFVWDTIVAELQDMGFELPSRRSLNLWLMAGLEDLPTRAIGSKAKQAMCCSFSNLLNLVWAPVLEYMDSLASDAAPGSPTASVVVHQESLLTEMAGVVVGADESMDMDKWIEFVKETLLRLLQVDVPSRLIAQVLSPIVPVRIASTPANAMHILRSSWCCKLVGPALAAQASRMVLAEIAEVPVQLYTEAQMNQKIKQDLIASLAREHCDPEPESDDRPAKKMRRDAQSKQEAMRAKTAQVLFMLENRLAGTRVYSTILSANALAQSLSSSSSITCPTEELDDLLVTRTTLNKHMLLLDGALDRCMAEKLLSQREAGTFAGVALATDESPPKQPRFRSLRFQITVFYLGTFKDLMHWDASPAPPIDRRTCLADLAHCPGKTGVDVSRIIEKQLARLGLNSFDVVSGTGDGGGENEGHQGVHAYFENLQPGYVRRRCLPHIAWRTCDVAIRTSGIEYKAIAGYLVEGVTWGRLRQLATVNRADGGLGLFSDGSQQCKDIFGLSPSAIVDNRPETDLNLLKLLDGREHILHKLAVEDLQHRSLSAETKAAILNLGDMTNRIRRRLLQEILERCLYLYYWTGKHPTVTTTTSWDTMLQIAVSIILSLEITPEVLKRFKTTQEDLQDLTPRPRTWVELAVLQVVGDEVAVAERLQEALEFHKTCSEQAAAHLNLVGDNTYRTPWLAAKLLSTEKVLARDAAAALVKHLVTIRPGNRSPFEQHLFEHSDLWANLEAFSQADPPTLLWHQQGKYESLFRFLAPRFLLGPDHVLDAERVHARWQWLCIQKRALKLHTLNGTLRLMHHLEHQQALPCDEDIAKFLEAERLEHKVSLEAIEEADVARGWRLLGRLQQTKKRKCQST